MLSGFCLFSKFKRRRSFVVKAFEILNYSEESIEVVITKIGIVGVAIPKANFKPKEANLNEDVFTQDDKYPFTVDDENSRGRL